MTIERMKHVWLLVESERLTELLQLVSHQEIMHVIDLSKAAAGSDIVGTVVTDLEAIEARVSRLQHLLDVFNAFNPPKRTFADNFLTIPLEVTRQEYQRARHEPDSDRLPEEVVALVEQHGLHQRRLAELSTELRRLVSFRDSEAVAPPQLTHSVACIGEMAYRSFQKMSDDSTLAELAALQMIARDNRGRTLVRIVYLASDEEAVSDGLRKYDFEIVRIPETDTIAARVTELESQAAEEERRLSELRKQISDLAATHQRAVTIQLGQAEAARDTLTTLEDSVTSERMAIVTGYVRRRDMAEFEKTLTERFAGIGIVTRDPAPDETVPVSLRTNKLFVPGEFLAEMFGVPDYYSFDPGPFITVNFLIFFGFCFGDVLYGALLIILGGLLAWSYRAYHGKRQFFQLLAYGGVTSLVVGLLTGSWGADIWAAQYLGPDNPLMRLVKLFQVTDPLQKPMLALGIALGIGVVNQFYAILMRMYSLARQRRYLDAFLDGGLWLVFLPGVIVFAFGKLGFLPAPAATVGMWLTIVGAAGLVLTQGRNEKTLFAKALVGVISLYGIMGTYGATSFLGDTLSYCRLLALGLTTTVVGMCFNLIGSLMRDIPYVGLLIFVLILVIGHTFNFLVSILGAFVHSGRLIFVEFFGRFYDASGLKFRPLGGSERVRVIGEV